MLNLSHLCISIILCFTLFTSTYAQYEPCSLKTLSTLTRPWILVVAPYERGHCNPLFEIAKYLHYGDTRYHICMAVPHMVDTNTTKWILDEGLNPIDAGVAIHTKKERMSQFAKDYQVTRKWMSSTSAWASMMAEANYAMYTSLSTILSALPPSHHPSFLIYDIMMSWSLDLLHHIPNTHVILSTPFFSDSFQLTASTTWHTPTYDLPADTGHAHDSTWVHRMKLLLWRVIIIPLQSYIYEQAHMPWRNLAALPSIQWDIGTQLHQHGMLAIVPSAFPMEPARPIHPAVHLLGAYIYANHTGAIIEPDLQSWLDDTHAQGHGIIYVSMGSVGSLTTEQAMTLLTSLITVVQDSSLPSSPYPKPLRVLWARGQSLFASMTLPPFSSHLIRLEKFVPQKLVLAHKALILYVNHCGMGSMHEALYYGIPSLALPLFGDQMQVALRAVSVGAAIYLDKYTMTTTSTITTLHHLLTNTTYRDSARRMRSIFQHAGGVGRVSSLIDVMNEIGKDGVRRTFTPYDQHYSFLAVTSIDTWIVLLCAMTIVTIMIRHMIRFCISRCFPIQTHPSAFSVHLTNGKKTR